MLCYDPMVPPNEVWLRDSMDKFACTTVKSLEVCVGCEASFMHGFLNRQVRGIAGLNGGV